jgi:hypothetical protein
LALEGTWRPPIARYAVDGDMILITNNMVDFERAIRNWRRIGSFLLVSLEAAKKAWQ